jgi:hypothetical protein
MDDGSIGDVKSDEEIRASSFTIAVDQVCTERMIRVIINPVVAATANLRMVFPLFAR